MNSYRLLYTAMNPRDLDQTGNTLPIESPLNSPSLSSARLSPCHIPLFPSPSRLSPCPVTLGSSPSHLSPLSTSPSRLSPSSHFISSYSSVRLSPCPTCDPSTSPTRVSPCPVPLSPSVVLKKPIHISSFSQSLEQQNQIDSSPQRYVSLSTNIFSAVNRLITYKIKVFVCIIYVCSVYIYYLYINTHSYSIYFENIYMSILYIHIIYIISKYI